MNNGKQPVYPTMYTQVGDGDDDYLPLKDGQKTGWEVKFGGLTKREYFAIKAMQGFLSNPKESEVSPRFVLGVLGLPEETKYSFDEHYAKYVSKTSVNYADALLHELSKDIE